MNLHLIQTLGTYPLVHRIGLTRDSVWWVWGKVVGVCGIVLGLLAQGILTDVLTPKEIKILTVISTVILYLSGKYDASPLRGKY